MAGAGGRNAPRLHNECGGGIRNFEKIGAGVDVLPLLLELQRQPQLWNRNDARLSEHGPHWQTDDIWLRYKDEAENKASGSYANFGDEHDPIWYPAFYSLPSARKLIFDLMARINGERLGGILIYRIAPRKEILPHTDTGWHVEYYDKFNISVKSQPGCTFFYEDEAMNAQTGDVYWYVNHKPHWVRNESADDHIVLTVSIKTHKYRSL